jgi:circadian clock protein KaiC
VKLLLDQVERVAPARVVFDSLSEMRLLAQDALRYRRQMLAFKQFFAGRRCTVLLLDDNVANDADLQVQSIAHGVISLEKQESDFGAERRRMHVVKLRGQRFRGGYHDYAINTGGIEIFPRLVAAEHVVDFAAGSITSGYQAFDALIGGGLDRGTSNLFVGPAGSGKTTMATLFAAAAAQRGEPAAIYTFDETERTLVQRSDAMGMRLGEHLAAGRLTVQQIDPAELSPGEFAARVRDRVERGGVRVVMIDSLNGYMNAMPEERFLALQLHELLTYLSQQGVVTILIMAQHGLIGSMQAPADITYLSDTVVMFRFFEAQGAVKKAISVIKKRTGGFENTIREFTMQDGRIAVGGPLTAFHGVLSGIPTYMGGPAEIMRPKEPKA